VVRHFFGKKKRSPLSQIKWSEDSQGRVVRYAFVHIDFAICSRDNGRVLGYDNAHGYAERHWMGTASEVAITDFAETLAKFHAEVDELRRKHYGNKIR
jgi:hypothetical protein